MHVTVLVTHPDNTVTVYRVPAHVPGPSALAAAYLTVESLRRAESALDVYADEEGPATLRCA